MCVETHIALGFVVVVLLKSVVESLDDEALVKDQNLTYKRINFVADAAIVKKIYNSRSSQ